MPDSLQGKQARKGQGRIGMLVDVAEVEELISTPERGGSVTSTVLSGTELRTCLEKHKWVVHLYCVIFFYFTFFLLIKVKT